jgi:hypothetical protein
MNREEILEELLENKVWDIYSGNCWVSADGKICIPYLNPDGEDTILLEVREWCYCSGFEDDLDLLPEDDIDWVCDKIEAHFTEQYRTHLNTQLTFLDRSN